MSSTDIGRLGEAKVAARLVELGWYPFIDQSGKCPIDILAWKDGRTIAIQVKATNADSINGSYTIQVGSIRPNRSGNTIHRFDNSSCDYLAVYIQREDTVCFLPTGELPGRAIALSRDGKNKIHKFDVISEGTAKVAKRV